VASAVRLRYPWLLLSALIAGLAACAGRTEVRGPLPIASSDLANGIPMAMVDSLATRIAAAEIERARVRATYTPDARPFVLIEARVAALKEQLREISAGPRVPRHVVQYVLARLDERQVALAIDHRQLLVTFDPEVLRVRQSADEARLLEARRAELRALLEVTTRATSFEW
jgi:hypothetical protein